VGGGPRLDRWRGGRSRATGQRDECHDSEVAG
jgi:hypothetical protein